MQNVQKICQLVGFSLLFFLPVIESFNKLLSYDLLLVASLLISYKPFISGKIVLDKITAIWVILLIIFSISTTHSIDVYKSYFEYLRYIAYFLIFVSLRSYPGIKQLINRFYMPMIILNTVILSVLAVLYMMPFFNLPSPINGMNLFYPNFGHNHLSDILVFAVLILITLSIKHRRVLKFFLTLLGIIFVFLLIISFGRAAMVSLTLSVFVYAIFISQNYKLGIWLLFIGIVVIGYLTFSFYVSVFNPQININFPFIGKVYKPAIRENRLVNYYQAIVSFSKSPIFGTGLNTFRIIARKIQPGSSSWYAHNHYLQIFTETGVSGGILFLTLVLTLLFSAFKNINQQFHGLFILLLATSIQSLLDFNWQYHSIFLFFWMGAALSLPAKSDLGKDKKLPWNLFWIVVAVLYLFAFELPFHNSVNIY